jgi:hypothetical protein
MTEFVFCSTIARGADRKVESRAGLIFDTPRGMYEVYINGEGEEFFFFNIRPVKGLPIDEKHVKDTAKLFTFFAKHRDDLQRYALTRDVKLWWEIKQKIEGTWNRMFS